MHSTGIFTHDYLSQPIVVSQLEIQRASSLPTATHELFPFPDIFFRQVELVKLSFAGWFPIGIYTCNTEHSSRELSAAINCKLPLYFFRHTGTFQSPAEKLSSFSFLSAATLLCGAMLISKPDANPIASQGMQSAFQLAGIILNKQQVSYFTFSCLSSGTVHLLLRFEQHSLEKSVLKSLRTTQLSVKVISGVMGQKPTQLYRSTFLIEPGGIHMFLHKIAPS